MAVRVSVDTDTWWHLRAGQHIVEQRQIIRIDPFSLTRRGEPWIYPGWLAQVLLFNVYDLAGFAGLNLLTAGMVVLTFICIWPLLDSPLLMRSAVLLLAATTSAVYWSARPQIFSFLMSGIFLLILWKSKEGRPKILWFLPFLMAIWSNLHGGFAIGFMLILAFLLAEILESFSRYLQGDQSWREIWRSKRDDLLRWVAVGVGCAAAVCLNPHGPQMLLYPFKTVSVGVLQDYIQEWQSPDFHHLEAQPFLWMLILTMISFALVRVQVDWLSLMLVSGFAYLSFLAARNIASFALVSAPVLDRQGYAALRSFTSRLKKGREIPKRLAGILNLILMTLIVFAAILKVAEPLNHSVIKDAIAEQVPVEAVDFILHEEPDGALFNSYNWGGYVLWSMYPHYLSFVDGRTDLFNDEILEDYLMTWRADPGWERVFETWNIRLVLIEPGAPLAKILMLQGWEPLYADPQAVVLIAEKRP